MRGKPSLERVGWGGVAEGGIQKNLNGRVTLSAVITTALAVAPKEARVIYEHYIMILRLHKSKLKGTF